MYGKDIERIIATICSIKNAAVSQTRGLSMVSDYRMETIDHSHRAIVTNAPHDHPDGTHTHFVHADREPTNNFGDDGPVSRQLTYPEEYTNDKHPRHPHVEHSIIYEREHPESGPGWIAPILAASAPYTGAIVPEMKTLEGLNYAGITTFNNCYGSPWQEIYDLDERLAAMAGYANAHSSLQWLGEKHTLAGHIQSVVAECVDAKWAIIYYQDYIQRGYDFHFNGRAPSITWDDFIQGQTIGQITQEIGENVRLRRPGQPGARPRPGDQ